MENLTIKETEAVFRPIASLISKSEKALTKLTPGTWQHTMLQNNLKALHIASVLMNMENNDAHTFTQKDLQEALKAFASMISRSEKAQVKFAPGTSQHTLQQNRLRSLRLASDILQGRINKEDMSAVCTGD